MEALPDATEAPIELPRSERTAAPEPASDVRRAPRFLEFIRLNWQATGAIVMLTLGIVFVMLGWWGAAHTNVATEQIPYLISGGLLGLGMIIVAGLLANSLSHERAMATLAREIAAEVRRASHATNGAVALGAAPTTVLLVKGGRSYHLAGCPIAEGKDGVREVSMREALVAGLSACKLCGSD